MRLPIVGRTLSPGRRWLLALLPVLAGCTPRVIPAGLAVGEPSVSAEHLTMADGARLPFHAWLPTQQEAQPPRAVLLGLHGFGDTSRNAFEVAAPLLTAQGLALYAYDQRGFGAAPHPGIWAGTATLVADAVAVTRLVRARHPGVPVFLLGESMGVAVLLVAAAGPAAPHGPPPAEGYALLAPAVRGRASMSRLMRGALEVAASTIPLVGFRGSAPGYAPTDSEAAMRRWSQDPLTWKEFRIDAVHGLVGLMDQAVAAVPRFRAPALILYGAQDNIVGQTPMRRAIRDFPAGAPHRFAYYAEGYHQLLRDRNRGVVARDIAAWAADPAAPLPSGADAAGSAWLAAEPA